jgi:hypothetical protein
MCSVSEVLVSVKKRTRVSLFLFRLGFGSIGTSDEAAWKASSGRCSGRSVVLALAAGVSAGVLN